MASAGDLGSPGRASRASTVAPSSPGVTFIPPVVMTAPPLAIALSGDAFPISGTDLFKKAVEKGTLPEDLLAAWANVATAVSTDIGVAGRGRDGWGGMAKGVEGGASGRLKIAGANVVRRFLNETWR